MYYELESRYHKEQEKLRVHLMSESCAEPVVETPEQSLGASVTTRLVADQESWWSAEPEEAKIKSSMTLDLQLKRKFEVHVVASSC